MKDFFISYTQADRAWAEWIAWQIEDAGRAVVIQAWDFRPGANFVLEMQRAAAEAERTIAVLSPDYLAARFTQPEWAAAFAQDPLGERGLLLPVRVRECALAGLLPQIIYIDLVGLPKEAARAALLAGIDRGRARPDRPPAFPGSAPPAAPARPGRPRFPGALPSIWNVPYLRNPNFTGRAALLSDLRAALESGRSAALTQALHGLGGVGKTQLAVEYAYRHSADYAAVWWLRAETPAALAADYAGLAGALDLPERVLVEQSLVVAAVRRWLEQNSGWLLIFDNANDPADLADYLPRGPGGHVLVTSRNPGWGQLAGRLLVQTLEQDEAIELLLRSSGQRDRAGSARLAETLGRLPLALAQAGAYMEATGRAPADYLALFASHQSQLLAEGQPSGYPATVATTWDLSFQRVRKGSRAAAELLYLCAFLGPDAIPFDVVRAGAQHLPKSLASALADPLKSDRALAALRRYSLAEVSGAALTVHRMIQAVVRARLDEEGRRRWSTAAVQVVNAAFPYESDDARTWGECARLLPHALTATEQAERHDAAPETTAWLLNQIGLYLSGRAEYGAARAATEHSLAIRERVLEVGHPDVAGSLNNLASLLYKQGDYAGSSALLERALAIDERALGPDHAETATSLNNLSVLLQERGDFAGARPLLERALAICERLLGPNDPYTASALSNLGYLLFMQGDYAAAQPLLERALDIGERIQGSEHPGTAMSMNNLAVLLMRQGDYAGSSALLERALAIQERALGPAHPETAGIVNNLAQLHFAQRNYAEAQPLFARALAIYQQTLGPDHPYTAASLNSMAAVLAIQGDYEDARPALERALAIQERALGPMHPAIAQSLNNLASALIIQGDYPRAQPLFERALEIFERAFGPDHSETATYLNNLAELLRLQGQRERARPLYARALAIDERTLGPDHPTTQTIRANLALLEAA